MARKVLISIGSNLGERIANCLESIERIAENKKITVIKKSSFYETEPWGIAEQGKFINAIIEVETALSPAGLLEFLKSIEAGMGRGPEMRWGPRVIDLDIIFYGDEVIDEKGLKVPHPHMHERAFVLVPMNEIAPDYIHPVFKKTVSELLSELKDTGGVRRVQK